MKRNFTDQARARIDEDRARLVSWLRWKGNTYRELAEATGLDKASLCRFVVQKRDMTATHYFALRFWLNSKDAKVRPRMKDDPHAG